MRIPGLTVFRYMMLVTVQIFLMFFQMGIGALKPTTDLQFQILISIWMVSDLITLSKIQPL